MRVSQIIPGLLRVLGEVTAKTNIVLKHQGVLILARGYPLPNFNMRTRHRHLLRRHLNAVINLGPTSRYRWLRFHIQLLGQRILGLDFRFARRAGAISCVNGRKAVR